jgi:hypothetical protein
MVLLMIPIQVSPAETDAEPLEYTCSRGLTLKIIKDANMQFIHAQLLIYYREDRVNPAIPYLTWMNLFDPNVNKSDSSLSDTLKKLGNDFEVEQRPDFLVFKINFLSDKIPLFIKFLKQLYDYEPFTEATPLPGASYSERKKIQQTAESFKDSLTNFWKYFLKKKEWKKTIAYQIAYDHFFPDSILGNTFIEPKRLNNLTLDHIRSFYRHTYILPNSLLIIKGNIQRPVLLYGKIESAFGSTKKHPPLPTVKEKIAVNPQKKIVIFNVDDNESPIIFWFEALSTYNDKNPIPALILNNILFLYPTGRLFTVARGFDINPLTLNTEMVNHNTVSVICNIIRLRYRDIERFIVMAEREKKKLDIMRIDRREHVNTLSNLIKRLKVKTQDFEHDVTIEKMKTPYRPQPITLAELNQVVDEPGNLLIVIIGNARRILNSMPLLRSRVKVIDFGFP